MNTAIKNAGKKDAIMENVRRGVFALAACATFFLLAPPLGASDNELATEVALLVGRPGTGSSGESGDLVVPGAVIPVRNAEPRARGATPGLDADQRALWASQLRIGRVADDLVKSLRLSVVELKYRMPVQLMMGEPYELPPPSGGSKVELSLELLGYNDSLASYQVQIHDHGLPVANTPLTVRLGEQAVVGGLGGEDAPYLFLVLAPRGSNSSNEDGATGEPIYVEGDVQPPVVIHKTQPSYSAEAKSAKIEGEVIVSTVIAKDGTIAEVKVLRGLPHGLSEAAVAAIEQWRFEPARLDGEPVAVYYHLTINFRLQKDSDELTPR